MTDAITKTEDVFYFMAAFDNEDATDEVWQSFLEEGVVAWNKLHGAKLDPTETFYEYVFMEART